ARPAPALGLHVDPGPRRMRCALLLHTQRVDLGAEFVSAPAVAEIARAAEHAGFDAVAVTDHPFPHDEWMRSGGHHALDPFVALGHTALPRPLQQPHPPIWVGGNSKRAIRRAVELGDGWMPIFNPAAHAGRRRTPAIESAADVRARLAYAAEVARAAGRTRPLEVAITARGLGAFGTPHFDPEAFLADVAELCAAGVTYLNVNLPAASRAEHVERIARFGDQVLARLP